MRTARLVLTPLILAGGCSASPVAEIPDAAPTSPDASPPPPQTFAGWSRFLDLPTGLFWNGALPVSDVAADEHGALVLSGFSLTDVDWAGTHLTVDPSRGSALLLALSPDGKPSWAKLLPGADDPALVSAGSGRILVVTAHQLPVSYQITVHALTPGGDELWHWDVPQLMYLPNILRADGDATSIWVHGGYTPFLTRLTADGQLDRAYTFPTPDPVTADRVVPLADGVVMAGDNGVSRWDRDGHVRWTTRGQGLSASQLVRGPDDDLLYVGQATQDTVFDGRPIPRAQRFLVRMSPDDGHVRWMLPFSFGVHSSFVMTGVATRPGHDDILLAAVYSGIASIGGEARGAWGGAAALLWLGGDGELRGLHTDSNIGIGGPQVFATADSAVLLAGNAHQGSSVCVELGDQVACGAPSTGPYAAAIAWSALLGTMGPRCGHLETALVPTPVDLHLVVDVSRGMSARVPSGERLRDLVGQGVGNQLLLARPNALRFTILAPPVYGRGSGLAICNHFYGPTDRSEVTSIDLSGAGLFYETLALAPENLDPALNDALFSAQVNGAAFSVDYAAGSVRHAAAILIASPDNVPTGCDFPGLLAQTSGAGSGVVPMPTHVIGVGTTPSAELDATAAAGGTGHVLYLAPDATLPTTVASAISDVRASYRCSYEGKPLRADQLPLDGATVTVTPSGGSPATVPRVDACPADGNGWMVEHRAWAPTILLCPATCALVEGGAAASLAADRACKHQP